MPLMTIFTAPKPFTNPHIAMIQRNAIQSWVSLGPQVEVILIGNEAGMAEAAQELKVRHLPDVKCNSRGTPLVSSVFGLAHETSDSPLLSCINADMLVLPDYVQAAENVMRQLKHYLVIGRRWDLDVRQPIDFSAGWEQRLGDQLRQSGKLHAPSGSDYFIFPRECFTDMPDFAIGRPGWDNWTIYSARRHGWDVVDASQGVTIIHQNHDYSHLPGGKPPYGGPEAGENLRHAGSKRAIFFQKDATWLLVGDQLKRPARTWTRFWREVEIFPMVKLGSHTLAQIFHTILHPITTFRESRQRR